MNNEEFNVALAKLDAAIAHHHESFRTAALPGNSQICSVYQALKPFLGIIIAILEKVPIWGGKVAAALTALIQLLDAFCATPA